jgi:hypothetical protein
MKMGDSPWQRIKLKGKRLIIVIDGGILAKESKTVEERSVLGVFGTVQKG